MFYQGQNFPLLSFATFVSILPTIIFLLLFLHEYMKTKQQMFLFLVGTLAVYTIQHFFGIRSGLVTTETDAEISFLLFQMLKMLTLYCLLLVLEMFERNTPFSGRVTVLTAIVAATIGAGISNPSVKTQIISGLYYVHFVGRSPVRLLQGLFSLVAGLWLLIVLLRSFRNARSPKQKRLIVLIAVGLFFCQILGSALPVVIGLVEEDVISNQAILFLIMGIEFNNNIGMFIIGYAFYRASKQPWLLQRQKVHLLLVYSKEGLDLFSKIFSNEITPEDVTLLTGGFTAVASMFQEAMKTADKVHSIQFERRTLRLLNRADFISALLIDYPTQASELALQKFTEEFEKQYGDKLRNFTGNVSQFEKATLLADQYFS